MTAMTVTAGDRQVTAGTLIVPREAGPSTLSNRNR